MQELNAEVPIAMADLAPSETAVEPIEIVPPGVDVFQEGAQEASAAQPKACLWCRAQLPVRENLNFCPFCGTDVNLVPCNACGEELDPDWRFCIACGTEVGG
jgi:RNA polymerase subunit RPABC4/transcription elongation factor Spt4